MCKETSFNLDEEIYNENPIYVRFKHGYLMGGNNTHNIKFYNCLSMTIQVSFPKFGSYVTIPTNSLNQGKIFYSFTLSMIYFTFLIHIIYSSKTIKF